MIHDVGHANDDLGKALVVGRQIESVGGHPLRLVAVDQVRPARPACARLDQIGDFGFEGPKFVPTL